MHGETMKITLQYVVLLLTEITKFARNEILQDH